MRATKGLWAAVGAGTSLAAAALLALVSVSVILAVHGWPQVSKAQDDGSVALRAQIAAAAANATSAAASAPEPVVLPAHSARQRRPTSHGRGSARRPADRVRPGTRPAVTGSGPSGSAPTTGAPSAPAGTSSPPSAPSGSGPVAQVPHTVATTVTNGTATAGEVLAPVSPAVANTVTATGHQVDDVGKTVGGVVGGLTGGK